MKNETQPDVVFTGSSEAIIKLLSMPKDRRYKRYRKIFIKRILIELEKYLIRHSELRVGQALVNIMRDFNGSSDAFYLDDAWLLGNLKLKNQLKK